MEQNRNWGRVTIPTDVDVIPETKEENDLIVHIVKECF